MPTRLIPWLFVAGMAIVVAVNGVLVYFAIGTWSGLVVERPYERGIQYNRLLDAAARQDALGWQFSIALESADTETTRIVVTASDAAGRPLHGLDLRATVERPVEREAHSAVVLIEQEPGRYAARLERLRPGQWETRLIAERGAESASAAHRQVVR
jgi:nitrogen fixation protein FixH